MSQKKYEARRCTIYLGDIPLEVFWVVEVNEYRLSQTQVLDVIGASKDWLNRVLDSTANSKTGSTQRVSPKKAPKLPKTANSKTGSTQGSESKKAPLANSESLLKLQHKGFTGQIIEVSIAGESKARQAKTISVEDSIKIWGLFAKYDNDIAFDILEVCAAESIERRADKAFDKKITEEEYNRKMLMRLCGKRTRRQLTDAIKDWIARQPNPESNGCLFAYSNASDSLNRLLFGMSAKKLSEKLGIVRSNLREYLEFEQLVDIEKLEDTAVLLIDKKDLKPVDAIKEAHRRIFTAD